MIGRGASRLRDGQGKTPGQPLIDGSAVVPGDSAVDGGSVLSLAGKTGNVHQCSPTQARNPCHRYQTNIKSLVVRSWWPVNVMRAYS